MKVLVAGADGYQGFCLSVHLANGGFDVVGVGNFSRRKWVAEVGSHSATPIKSMQERLIAFEQTFGKRINFEYGDLTNYGFVHYVLDKYRPDAVVHLGEQPSAPYDRSKIVFDMRKHSLGAQ
jgi:UDP-sulfoquinovose synthase